MELQGVKSKMDIIKYYLEKDKNKNEKLEPGEVPEREIKKYDKSGDGALSPWEVMEAANHIHGRKIFSPEDIATTRERLFFTHKQKLRVDTDIRGIKFKAGTDMLFYTNGQIDAKLGGDTDIQGKMFKKGTEISFTRQARLSDARLSAATEINGQIFKPGTQIWFSDHGQIKMMELTEDTIIQGIKFQKQEIISLHANGRIEYGTLANDTVLPVQGQDIKFKAGKKMHLRGDGQVSGGTLVADTIIKSIGVMFKAGTWIAFRKEGIFYGTSAMDVVVQATMFWTNEIIVFDSNGKIVPKDSEEYRFLSEPPRVYINRR